MIHGLERATGHEAKIDWQPEQPGDVPQTWANVEKARQLLGYVPKTSFAAGIGKFAEWVKRPADAVRAVKGASCLAVGENSSG